MQGNFEFFMAAGLSDIVFKDSDWQLFTFGPHCGPSIDKRPVPAILISLRRKSHGNEAEEYFILSRSTLESLYLTSLMRPDPYLPKLRHDAKLRHGLFTEFLLRSRHLLSIHDVLDRDIEAPLNFPVGMGDLYNGVAVPITVLHGRVREAASSLTGKVYADIEEAFDDIFSQLGTPTFLGLSASPRVAAIGLPFLYLSLCFLVWQRVRHIQANATVIQEPWILLAPNGYLEKIGALIWKIMLASVPLLVMWAALLFSQPTWRPIGEVKHGVAPFLPLTFGAIAVGSIFLVSGLEALERKGLLPKGK